jgi:hypothetical protein
MSETTFKITPETLAEVEQAATPERTPEEQARYDQRLEILAKGRATRIENAAQRKAEARTAKDAAKAGVGSNPGAAEPARATRDERADEVITRVRRDERDSGWADLPKHQRKPGWDYEYKTIRVYNEPVDPGEMLEIRNAGWRPEKAVDWPDLVEPGTSPDAPIERRGQRLYGRPMRLTHEARQEDLAAAYQQQRDKTMAAASGKSATRGEEGIPNGRGVRSIPISVEIEGLAG